jgi:pimeloyl-ACP methyl ester carboxylesterase
VTPRLGLAAISVLLAACRATPIAPDRAYPAGTAFRAQERVVDGTRLRMIDTGRGAPVVFVHGFGASLYSWRKTLPAVVAAGYRAIAFDNRGFGFSAKPADGYDNAAYTRLVVALLDTLGISSAVLVGHSMGGAIVADVALAHADRVRGLVLIDPAGYGIRFPGLLKLARWPVLGAMVPWFRGRWITGRLLRSTYADASKVSDADVDQYYAPVPDPGYGRALRGVLRQFRFDSLVGRLADLDTPTLVVWGSADRWIPLRDGSRLASDLPRAAFVVIPETGHAAAEEAADAVNRPLMAFLRDGLPRLPANVALEAGKH